MTNYKFTEEDSELIKELYLKSKNVSAVARRFCESRNLKYDDSYRKNTSNLLIRMEITKPLTIATEEPAKLEEDYKFAKNRKLKKSKYYIVTWEQNETPIHKNLWKNILAYKEFLNAELSVILGRYKNPTSVFQDVEHETWSPETRPYWDTNRHDIHKYLTILGDVKIQPTAERPLSGLESITGPKTTIVGNPKLHMKPIAVLEGHPKKILLTTGAISLPNYTDSKAGKKGEFKHKLGFVIVEVKDKEVFFIRQVEADTDGNFIDLFYEVSDGKVYANEQAKAIVWGDTHVGAINPDVMGPTEELIDRLDISVEVHHDLSDGTSVNNHIVKNPIEQFLRMQRDEDKVEEELNRVVDFVGQRDTLKIIVQTNHNDRFDRWLINQDWRKDIVNALPYLKYTTAVLEGSATKGVLAYVLENNFRPEEVLCLDYDDSYMIGGYEIAHHGHIGANGSRGSAEQFSKMSTKIIIGHSHTPVRIDDVLSVGTSTHLRESYNKGASSWLNAHVLIHENNTAQHIIFVNGEYTTF